MGANPAGTSLSTRSRHYAFARLFSSAVISQALLSAASFAVGLILIRRTSDLQYGSYILASSAILLLVSLQNAFCKPPLARGMNQLDRAARADLVGGLRRELQGLLRLGAAAASAVALGLWGVHVLDPSSLLLVLATIGAGCASLNREYFRLVLFAHRRPHEVLRTDVLFALLMLAGVLIATRTSLPAVAAVFMLSLAAMASTLSLSKALYRHEPWTTAGAPPVLNELAPLAAWSTAGAAIHWTFSQGYMYVVAGTLDVAAVAAIAATRLLLMPVNLLSTGIGSLMLPVASGWLQQHGAALLLRRLALFALGLAGLTIAYFAVLWLARDWLFAVVLRKDPAQRDTLLLLWGALCLVMVVRDQLAYLLAAQGRFRFMALLTLASAVLALTSSYAGMLRWGVPGALVGLLIGELVNLCGIAVLTWRVHSVHPRSPSCAISAVPTTDRG
jgi:hypothetical protein